MGEQLKELITACIVGSIPQIAEAVVEELNSQPKRVETVSRLQAANQLGVSIPTLDDLIKNGTIRARKLGRRVIIPASEIENLLASGEPIKYRRAKA